ncbi:MAG: heme biosynthesis protein HemY [Micavibrio aeruginosavorus]|nr:heme biosynthesis protein HemY [Micavibrio aeruginosavorus]
MLRTLWGMIQFAAVAAAALWLYSNPGTVSLHWNEYDVETTTAVAFVILVVAVFIITAFTRIVGFIVSLPSYFKNFNLRKRRDRGFRALTLGLSAVAAGDAKLATYHAYKMRRFIPDEKGLPDLLEGQAARLRGDETEARAHFEKLLKDKDTAFLGVRGLLYSAIEAADADRALEMARQALAMHPGQPWIIRTVFGLEVEKHEWMAALATLKKAERARAFSETELRSSRIAILIQQADELLHAGYQQEALKKFRDANRIDPAFAPAAQRLAKAYISAQKRRAAIAVIERAWKDNPHVDLIPVWESLAPPHKDSDMAAKLRWFERLVALKPGDVESQIAAAQAAIADGLWGEAWQYLAAAEKIRPSARLYRLWAQMEEATGHAESARRYWEKVANAPAADKVWICKDTGIIYESWSPFAAPHGAFNTIVWDNPRPLREAAPAPVIAARNDLVIEPVKEIAARG